MILFSSMTAETGVKYYPLPKNGRYAGQLEEHLRSLGLPEPLARTMSESVHRFTWKRGHSPCAVVKPGLDVSLKWPLDETVLPSGVFTLELRPEEMSFQSTSVGRTVDILDLGQLEACGLEETGWRKTLTVVGTRGIVRLRKNFGGIVTAETEEKVGRDF